jgi:hypothetical protein
MHNLTLVAFYGQKHSPLKELIESCHQMISKSPLGKWIIPYATSQIHATLTGLEWFEQKGKPVNTNYFHKHGKPTPMIMDQFSDILNETFPLSIRFGGFSEKWDDFRSSGKKPFERSFVIDRITQKAMIIGWPVYDGKFQKRKLEELRNQLEAKCNISHKYSDDNDLYLVLGDIRIPDIDNALAENLMNSVEREIRDWFFHHPFQMIISREDLSFVRYKTSELPRKTSQVYPYVRSEKDILKLFS